MILAVNAVSRYRASSLSHYLTSGYRAICLSLRTAGYSPRATGSLGRHEGGPYVGYGRQATGYEIRRGALVAAWCLPRPQSNVLTLPLAVRQRDSNRSGAHRVEKCGVGQLRGIEIGHRGEQVVA